MVMGHASDPGANHEIWREASICVAPYAGFYLTQEVYGYGRIIEGNTGFKE